MKQDQKSELSAALKRFCDWYRCDALPLWTARGYDEKRGGFYEALNFDATPSIDRPRRVRSQARQIHAFSQAGLRGWSAHAETHAAAGFDYFLTHACSDNGERGCVHLLDDRGAIIDDRRDLYDQAFLLLACASRWQAAKDPRALQLAENAIAFLDRELASPFGGWCESDRKELPRRQNPHMHLFEAFLALHSATKDARYLDFVSRIYADCFRAFYDPSDGIIIERFNEDFSYDKNSGSIEPGHMFEWVWLLRFYEDASNVDFSDIRRTLYSRGAHIGGDPNFRGFVNNVVPIDETPRRGAKRLWPQTEYLRASLVQAGAGDNHARERALSLVNDLSKTYLNVEPAGLWIDEFDSRGAPIAQDVPASILYHLHEAAAEAERCLKSEDGA